MVKGNCQQLPVMLWNLPFVAYYGRQTNTFPAVFTKYRYALRGFGFASLWWKVNLKMLYKIIITSQETSLIMVWHINRSVSQSSGVMLIYVSYWSQGVPLIQVVICKAACFIILVSIKLITNHKKYTDAPLKNRIYICSALYLILMLHIEPYVYFPCI